MNSLILQCCIYGFFVSVITFWDSKNVSIFFNSIFYDRKVNPVSTLVGQK